MWANRITIAFFGILFALMVAVLILGPHVGLASEDMSPPQCHEVRC